MNKRHPNTIKRALIIYDLTLKHYEEGNAKRNYKNVWRRYIYPVYPMCYDSFLKHLQIAREQTEELRSNRELLVSNCILKLFDEEAKKTYQ